MKILVPEIGIEPILSYVQNYSKHMPLTNWATPACLPPTHQTDSTLFITDSPYNCHQLYHL